MTERTLSCALWAANLSFPVSSMEDWAGHVEKQIVSAKEKGAVLFLMPEYASEQWLHFASRVLLPTEQIAWMAAQTQEALPLLAGLAMKHDILLVSGTFPCPLPGAEPPFSNRAHVFFPDGRLFVQDKLCLTPKEKNPEGWQLSPGAEIRTFMWKGWKIAVFICLDIELPALSAKMAQEHIDLVLVPSMTKKLAGYHRVFDCAKARAVELQAAVGVCGAIANGPGREPNISGAAFYVPCEEQLGHTGTLAAVPPARESEGAGPLLIADLPLGVIRDLRTGGAEVWPGAWSASGVEIRRES